MDTSTGYWRCVKMDRSKKYIARYWCITIEEFAITDYVWPYSEPLIFEFVNGAWQARFHQSYADTYYYNGQEVQPGNNIIIKDGDSLRVKYASHTMEGFGADVTMYYKEDTVYWNVEEEIMIKEKKWKVEVDSLQRQNQETAVQLESANKSIDQCKELEAELRKQIADLQLQQQMQEDRGQLAKSVEKLQEVMDELGSANKANHEGIRKYKEVETELRVKIADLQGALQLQQEVKEKDQIMQLPKSDSSDVNPQPNQPEKTMQLQPNLQFPAILEEKKLQSVQIIEEIASIWERERSEMNDKIAKLTQQLEENQDQDLLRTEQVMTAMTMLNQVLQKNQTGCQVLEGCEDTFKVKEAK